VSEHATRSKLLFFLNYCTTPSVNSLHCARPGKTSSLLSFIALTPSFNLQTNDWLSQLRAQLTDFTSGSKQLASNLLFVPCTNYLEDPPHQVIFADLFHSASAQLKEAMTMYTKSPGSTASWNDSSPLPRKSMPTAQRANALPPHIRQPHFPLLPFLLHSFESSKRSAFPRAQVDSTPISLENSCLGCSGGRP
jgi:hypothetical protein